MVTKTLDVRTARIDLETLLAEVTDGVEIILTDGDTPLARLTPITTSRLRIAGLHQGAIQTSGDFDEPLPDDFWTGGS